MSEESRLTKTFSVNIAEVLDNKVMSFSQKAAILKLLEADEDNDGHLNHEDISKGKDVLKELKDSIVSTLANVAVVSALIGITTYASILSPLQPSVLDVPEEVATQGLLTAYTSFNMISTCFSLVTIGLCTFYTLILTMLLTTTEDFIWFVLHIPAVVITFIFCIVGIVFAVAGMMMSCYIVYSKKTADVTLSLSISILMIYCFLALGVAIPVFKRINHRLEAKKKSILGGK